MVAVKEESGLRKLEAGGLSRVTPGRCRRVRRTVAGAQPGPPSATLPQARPGRRAHHAAPLGPALVAGTVWLFMEPAPSRPSALGPPRWVGGPGRLTGSSTPSLTLPAPRFLPDPLSHGTRHNHPVRLLRFCPKCQAPAFRVLRFISTSSVLPGLPQKLLTERTLFAYETFPKKSGKDLENERLDLIKILTKGGAAVKDGESDKEGLCGNMGALSAWGPV